MIGNAGWQNHRHMSIMPLWLIHGRPLSLNSSSESDVDDRDVDDNASDNYRVSSSYSECSNELEDDDFDNSSVDIDDAERSKIAAQLNPEQEDSEVDEGEVDGEELVEASECKEKLNKWESKYTVYVFSFLDVSLVVPLDIRCFDNEITKIHGGHIANRG